MIKYNRVRHFRKLSLQAYHELQVNDPLRLAGATAFFTLFALPPIIIIITQVLSLLFNPERIRLQLFHSLSGIVGPESVEVIIAILKRMRRLAQNWYISVGGFIFLIFVSTTLFKVIRSSLNQMWKVRVIVPRNFLGGLQNRLRAIVVILCAGLLFLAGLLAETIQALMGKYVRHLSPTFAVYFNGVVATIVSVIIVTLWFAVLFHHLPDGRPTWKIALIGGFFTSLLFNIGKWILRWLLVHSNVTTIYGASGSIVLLLLFIFYASLIFYYGAAFTKVWAVYQGKPILPHSYAVSYEIL